MANENPRSVLSLYANLLGPSSATPGSISSAPVTYKQPETAPEQDEAAKKQQALAASLRFQPTKRPLPQNAAAAAAKAKAKAIASKFSVPQSAPQSAPQLDISPPSDNKAESKPAGPPPKTSIADWTATASDDEFNFYGEKRQRGGRKKRKKNKEVAEIVQDWDDIYDPSRPNNYEEYKNSEEKIREVREWKDLLYRRRIKRKDSSDYDSDRSEESPINRQFAPPSFAPPSNLNDEPHPPPADAPDDSTGDDAYARRLRLSQPQPPPDDPTGDDAYARRMRLSQQPPPPPPPPGQVSKAPVRYSLPAAPEELPATETELEERLAEPDGPRSSRPGQTGFAERLMSKYGWTKGQGLGAKGKGIINPLYAKADKRKKKSDAEGGGFATPAATGKILGGNKSKAAEEEEGKFGAMSEVIRLEHMLDGMDLDEEMGREGGGIMQEIGEECGDKYGSVERVYIHRDGSPLVFVQFVSQLSALRAVNALEGRIFNGNTIVARFWPKDGFLAEEYNNYNG